MNGEIQTLNKGLINISDWKSIEISMYSSDKRNWITLNEDNYDSLKEINESEYNENLILRGFGKQTGQWIEYKIASPKLSIVFD